MASRSKALERISWTDSKPETWPSTISCAFFTHSSGEHGGRRARNSSFNCSSSLRASHRRCIFSATGESSLNCFSTWLCLKMIHQGIAIKKYQQTWKHGEKDDELWWHKWYNHWDESFPWFSQCSAHPCPTCMRLSWQFTLLQLHISLQVFEELLNRLNCSRGFAKFRHCPWRATDSRDQYVTLYYKMSIFLWLSLLEMLLFLQDFIAFLFRSWACSLWSCFKKLVWLRTRQARKSCFSC